MKEFITSRFFSLNTRDFLRALLLAILAPILVAIQEWADAMKNGTEAVLDWKAMLMAAVGAGLAYLLKNLFTPAKKETPL